MHYPGRHRQSSIDPEVPESLDGVLSSLETLLEHRHHKVPKAVHEALESFADSMGEQYDDPLVAEEQPQPDPEAVPLDIPVLKDIVQVGDAVTTPRQDDADLDVLLESLRQQLDSLVDSIIDDARDRFSELLENASTKNSISLKDNLNDFMRDALRRQHFDK